MLVPLNVGTRWWQEWAVRGEMRAPIRACFGDHQNVAPFYLALVVFRPEPSGSRC
jgi:hypothetical protein